MKGCGTVRAGLVAGLLLALAGTWAGCGGAGGDGPDADAVAPDPGTDLSGDVLGDVPGDGDALPDAPDLEVPPGDLPPDDAPADLPEDAGACPPAPPAAGQVRARVMACDGERMTGAHAVGRVGDLVLENAMARFVVRGAGEGHALLGLWGGGLVDAAGVGGQDQLREFQPLVSFNVLRPDRVEVVDAGAGGQAVVAATGVPVPHPVLESVVPGIPLDAVVIQEYVLRPDEPWLRLRTRVQAVGGGEVEVIPGDLQMLGGRATPFVPGIAGGLGTAFSGPYFACAGGGASYGYVVPGAVSGLEVGGSEIFLSDPQYATADEEAVFERWFVAGDGSLSSVSGAAWSLRGEATAAVSGTVRVGAAAAGAGYRVDVVDGDGLPLTTFRTAADGAFAGRLPPGPATLTATCDGCPPGAPLDIAVDPSTGAPALVLTAGPPSFLEVTIRDLGPRALGPAVPGRASVESLDRPGDDPRFLFTGPGTARFPLAPGRYRVTLSRGLEYDVAVREPVVVDEGALTPLDVELARVVSTPGAIAAEFHLHSETSVDSAVPVADRVAACAAEGLEFVIATDHDFVTDYGPDLAALGLPPHMTAVTGCEVSSVHAGHFISWPLVPDADLAGNGAPRWFGLSPPALVDGLRADHPGSVVQVNHPRFQGESTYDIIGYDPADGLAHADPLALGFPADTDLSRMDYDAIEVFNGIGDEDLPKVLRDWYSLLNLGRRVTATAGGDSHTLDSFPGSPRNLVLLGTDDPAEATAGAVQAALRAMRIVVTSGPYIEAGLVPPAGGAPSLPGDLLTDSDGEVALQIAVQAPAWVDVDEVVVVANGVEGTPIPLPADAGTPPVLRYAATLTLPALADTWFVVIARGDTRNRLLSNVLPIAVTNPFFLDADGDGQFTPPGL